MTGLGADNAGFREWIFASALMPASLKFGSHACVIETNEAVAMDAALPHVARVNNGINRRHSQLAALAKRNLGADQDQEQADDGLRNIFQRSINDDAQVCRQEASWDHLGRFGAKRREYTGKHLFQVDLVGDRLHDRKGSEDGINKQLPWNLFYMSKR